MQYIGSATSIRAKLLDTATVFAGASLPVTINIPRPPELVGTGARLIQRAPVKTFVRENAVSITSEFDSGKPAGPNRTSTFCPANGFRESTRESYPSPTSSRDRASPVSTSLRVADSWPSRTPARSSSDAANFWASAAFFSARAAFSNPVLAVPCAVAALLRAVVAPVLALNAEEDASLAESSAFITSPSSRIVSLFRRVISALEMVCSRSEDTRTPASPNTSPVTPTTTSQAKRCSRALSAGFLEVSPYTPTATMTPKTAIPISDQNKIADAELLDSGQNVPMNIASLWAGGAIILQGLVLGVVLARRAYRKGKDRETRIR